MASRSLQLTALADFPLIEPGDDLAAIILSSLAKNDLSLHDGDVLVLAQKIVSKAENRYVNLADVEPDSAARDLAVRCDKDPRQMALVLRESKQILRSRPGVVIVEHKLGVVHANAGIDRSNIQNDDANPRVLLLPENPDRSAALLRSRLTDATGIAVHIIINDSAGRAWRHGTIGFALGTAGFTVVENRIGEKDMFDNILEVTEIAVADELAAAASYVMGQAAESTPVVLVRGAKLLLSSNGSQVLLRDPEKDMFR